MAQNSNVRNFRENLKHYFDLALKEPVKIIRGTEGFILMNESEFQKIREEMFNLQQVLISTLTELNEGGGKEMTLEEMREENQHMIKQILASNSQKKGRKKV